MLRFALTLRGRPTADGLDRIRATYRLDGKRLRFDSDLRCHPADWDTRRRRVKASAQRTPHHLAVNRSLSEAAARADAAEAKAIAEARAVVKAEVEHVLAALTTGTGRVRSAVTLLDYMAEHCARRGLSANTANKYATVRADLDRFAPGLDWAQVTPTLYADWVADMRARGLRASAWGKNVAVLKAVMRAGRTEGLHQNDAYEGFTAARRTPHTEARAREWLTAEQVDVLRGAALDGPHAYARDYFLVGLESGQRYSGWLAVLTGPDGAAEAGTPVVEVAQAKSGGKSVVTVPLTAELQRLRRRHADGLIPTVAYNTLRLHLRSLGRTLDLPPLTTHVARRTYGRLLWGRGVDVSKIQVAYGHSTAMETAHYLGLSAERVRHGVADELAQLAAS